MNIHVLGKGAWGVALGRLLQANGHRVQWSDHSDPVVWMNDLDFVLLSVPSKFLISQLSVWPAPQCPVISSVKGIEPDKCMRVSEMVAEKWGGLPFAVVSGPSFANEVEKGHPTAIVAASVEDQIAQEVQKLFHRAEFRVYRSGDVCGVELGGALKNVYAIGAGFCQGLKLGDNSLAAMITRALAEMARIGVALGGKMETFMGLSGAGDLMLTCYGGASRNRSFGETFVQMKFEGCADPLTAAQRVLGGTAEGVTTVQSVKCLVDKKNISAPLLEAVDQIVYGGKEPARILSDLLSRSPESELRV